MQEEGATVRQVPEELSKHADSPVRAESQRSKLKGTEKALKQSERNYEELVDSIDGIVWEADARSFQFCFVSKQAERLLGYPASQWLAKPTFWQEHIHPDDRDKTIAFCLKATEERRAHEFEYRMMATDGRTVWLRDIVTVVVENGQPMKLRGVMVDITERKRAEEELRKHRDHLEELVQERTREIEVLAEFPKNNPNPVLRCDSKGEIIYMNPAMHCLKTEAEWSKSNNIKEIFPDTYAEIVDIIGTDKTITNREIKLNGRAFLLTYNSFPDEQNALILIHEITERKQVEAELQRHHEHLEELVDKRTAELISANLELEQEITERKQAEEQIRRMSRGVESAGECIVMTDLDGTIQYVNPAFTRFTGYTAEEAVGQKPRILNSGRQPRQFYKQMWDTILSGEVWRGEITNRRKDGTLYDAVLTIAPVFDQKGNLEGFVAIQNDITERKQAERDLREAKQQAEISDRLKSTFLGIMSHEVRTPLNAMLGFNDLLALELKEQLSDLQKGFVETIRKSGDRLKHLMDDILDISQIEADRTVLEMGSFRGDDLVEKSVTNIVLSAREKNLEVIEEYEVPDLRIRLDDLRFQQAVGNILQNAVKFTHEGSITVSTKVENDEYRVVVRDTGIGIRDKFKPYLFSLFRQAEEGYDRSYEGAGLGLAISQRLVEAMNGRIEVESKVGEGSTFTIIMPAERKEAPALKPEMVDEVGLVVPTPLRPPAQSVGEKIEKATVLILEDNPANLKFNEFLVKKLNLDHISAETGEKALELVKGKPVDCMLIDISLAEGMTGIEFMKKARQRKQFKNIPMIAVTAHSMVRDRERFLKHGFDDYLAKPFTIKDLKSVLNRNLLLW